MTKIITKLVDTVKKEAAMAYAKVELERNLTRKFMSSAHPATQYFLSTENKRHLSNLLYVAHQTRKPIGKLKAASELGITRQAVSAMLDEATDAGWVVKTRRGYMYSDEMAEGYTQTVSKMLVSLSTDLSQKVVRMAELLDFMSSRLTLTESQRGTILRTGGEHRETKKA